MRNLQTLRLPLLFRTLFTVGFVTLLMIDVFVLQNNNEVDKTKETTTAATMNNSITHAKGVKEDLGDGSKHGDLSHSASKRKVPRGPDPIHNRYFTGFLFQLSHPVKKSFHVYVCCQLISAIYGIANDNYDAEMDQQRRGINILSKLINLFVVDVSVYMQIIYTNIFATVYITYVQHSFTINKYKYNWFLLANTDSVRHITEARKRLSGCFIQSIYVNKLLCKSMINADVFG